MNLLYKKDEYKINFKNVKRVRKKIWRIHLELLRSYTNFQEKDIVRGLCKKDKRKSIK
jgi:hypothetical protein